LKALEVPEGWCNPAFPKCGQRNARNSPKKIENLRAGHRVIMVIYGDHISTFDMWKKHTKPP